MIQHTIVFKLKHPPGSLEEKEFLADTFKFSDIPGVQNFKCLRQTSKQNNYDFGISMEFASQEDYDRYTHHPVHQTLVKERWIPEVSAFLEIDYASLA